MLSDGDYGATDYEYHWQSVKGECSEVFPSNTSEIENSCYGKTVKAHLKNTLDGIGHLRTITATFLGIA